MPKIKKEFHYLSLDNIEMAKSSADKLIKRFNVFLEKARKDPNDCSYWNELNKIKHAVVSRMNKANGRGREDIAEVYMKTQKQMVLPPKGDHFWKYSDYWED